MADRRAAGVLRIIINNTNMQILKRPISKKKLIAELKKLQTLGDTEVVHGLADNLLLSFINDTVVTKQYEAIDRWYA